MAKRKTIKKLRRKAKEGKFVKTGYPEVDEFLRACLDEKVEKDDEVLSIMQTLAKTIGITKTALVMRHMVTRLFQMDDFYNQLMDDIETNLQQFERMRKMSVLGDEPEIERAHKNMMWMAARLDEFASQMEEMSGQKLRKKTTPMPVETMDKFADKVIKETARGNG